MKGERHREVFVSCNITRTGKLRSNFGLRRAIVGGKWLGKLNFSAEGWHH